VEIGRRVRELFEREPEEAGRRGGPALLEVDAGGGDLDQALKVPPIRLAAAEPGGFPLLVGLEEAPVQIGLQPSCETGRVEGVGNGQAFGRSDRMRSISSTSTYPSTRFTTLPDPSTKRMVG
jgi:hypothetical protein